MTGKGTPLHGAHVSFKIGSMVQVLTTDRPHGRLAVQRQGYEHGISVSIGENVWISSGPILLPSESIGDDAIIGTGSVARQDVPVGAPVIGNPAGVSGRKE